MNTLLPLRIESRILTIGSQRVMIDSDLTDLYGVPTKALNQAVKRNALRFPSDFMFQLNAAEKAEVVTNCDHLGKLKFSKALPNVFTEHGAKVFDALREFTTPPEPAKRPIGFITPQDKP